MSLTNPFTDREGGTNVERLDKAIDWGQKLTPIIVLGVALITVAILLAVNSRNDNDEAQACASIYANNLAAANVDVNALIANGLYALAEDRPEMLDAASDSIPDAVAQAQEAVEKQRTAVKLRRADIDKFLDQCNALR